MKKGVLFFILISLILSCKEEVVKKPENLIEKEIMVDVMYDLALLEAIKYQSPNALETNKINPDEYIFKKHKIDSAQFVQSNMYYASDYKQYKKMYDQISSRLKENKSLTEAAIKSENDKAQLLKKKSKK
jgi:hypothetical protein